MHDAYAELQTLTALLVEHPVTPNIAPVTSPAIAAAAANDPALLFKVVFYWTKS